MDRTYRYLDTDTLARLVDELYDEVCIYDNHYRMVYITKACLRHYGFEPDDLIGKELTDEVIVKASEEAMNSCHPISDIRASAEYRKDMIRVFTKRAIKQAMECS